MVDQTHANEGQQRLLKVIEELSRHLFEGIAGTDLAAAVGESPTNTFRALKNLEIAGWAEQRPSKAWCIAPHATQLSHRVHQALGREHDRYLKPPSQ